jgi:hypothetical protein
LARSRFERNRVNTTVWSSSNRNRTMAWKC